MKVTIIPYCPPSSGSSSGGGNTGSGQNASDLDIGDGQSGELDANLTFNIINDFGSGAVCQMILENTGTAPIYGWCINFNKSWTSYTSGPNNGVLFNNVNGTDSICNQTFNAAILPGQTVTVDFNTSPGSPSISDVFLVTN